MYMGIHDQPTTQVYYLHSNNFRNLLIAYKFVLCRPVIERETN